MTASSGSRRNPKAARTSGALGREASARALAGCGALAVQGLVGEQHEHRADQESKPAVRKLLEPREETEGERRS